MNDAPEETVEANPKTSRAKRMRAWVTNQSKLRLGLIGVLALALAAGTWTGVSYASDGSASTRAQPSPTAEAPETQSPSPDDDPTSPPEESESEKKKPGKAEPKPTEEETTTQEAAPGCEGYSGNPLTACRMLDDHGFDTGQMGCLNSLWDHESGWNHKASNPSSGAYGIPQALPGDKMATAGSDWSTNPATQIEWGLGYIGDRYGTPCGAWNFWQNNNYY